MIKLMFMYGREVMNFLVNGREVWYQDKIWAKGIRCIPKDEEFIKKIISSRNKIPMQLVYMFELNEKDKAEYEAAKTERELADNIIKDCKGKGLIFVKEIAE